MTTRREDARADDEGFTFVEVVIVAAVIAVLATVGILFLGGERDQARATAVQESADRGYSVAESAFHAGDVDIESRVESMGTDRIALSLIDEAGNSPGNISRLEEICVLAEWTGEEDEEAVAGRECESVPEGSSPPEEEDEREDSPDTGDSPSVPTLDTSFAVTYSVDSSREDGYTVELPIHGISGDLDLDCGDGTVLTVSTDYPRCSYDSSGTYTITSEGAFTGFGGDKDASRTEGIVSVSAWPETLTDMSNAFYDGDSLSSVATPPSRVENMNGMFHGAGSFDQDISHWDVSNVGDLGSMFRHADKFKQDISSWDTANVEVMSNMFRGLQGSFKYGVGDWDVSNVRDMSGMFRDIGGALKPDIENWDVSNVRDMSHMFQDTHGAFNEDISGWDTGNVVDMSHMFHDEKGAFRQDLSGWDVNNVRSYDDFSTGNKKLREKHLPEFG